MSYTKFLRWVLLVGASLVFFLPFIIADGSLIPNMFFPFITGKNFLFRLLVEVLLGAYILLALREPKYRPKASFVLYALGAFVLWVGVATVFSVDPIKSFWSNFERMEGYITTLHLFVYFVIVGAVVATENWWERFFQVGVAAGTLQALYGLGQLLRVAGLQPSMQSGARLDGTFGNAAYLGVFMLFSVFITLFLLVRSRKSTTAQVLYGIALVLQVATLFFTETRGALLGLVGGMIVAAGIIAWKAKEREWKTLRTVSIWGLGALAILIVLFVAVKDTSFVRNTPALGRLASISLEDRTTIARFYIWNMAWSGFTDSPKTMALGWGQENFSYVFNEYYLPQMYSQEQWFDRAHNQFLDWLIAAGLPAFLLYISFFGLVVWAVWRSTLSTPEQAVIIGLLAAYGFNNLFLFNDLMASVWFFILLALAHGLSREELHKRIFLSKPVGDHGVAIAAPIVVVVCALGMWTLNAPGIARAQNLLQSIVTQVAIPNGQGGIMPGQKDPKQHLQEFKVALGSGVWPGTPLGRQEAVEQLLQFVSSRATSNQIDPAVKKDLYQLAESAGIALNLERQNDARLQLFMGAFYDSHAQFQQAVEWLNKAIANSPKKQQIKFQLGVDYINMGNLPGAVQVLKEAFESEPAYGDARILYAAVLMYAGDMQTADKLLTEGFGTVLVDDQRMIQVYTNTKQLDRVIGIWKARVAKEPNNAQQYIGLATAYFTARDVPNTIAALQKAASVDPNLAAQVQSIITQIQNGTIKPQ